METPARTTAPETRIADELQHCIGRAMCVDDEIGLSAVRRIAAMVDQEPAGFQAGDAIPPHWYSMFFTPNARQSQIGHDGHPRKGDFLPSVPLPRRMFAGRRVEFGAPLRIGDLATKRSEIVAITQKTGRSGPLVFVTVRHTIEVDDRPAVIEHQEVVYRQAVAPGAASAVSEPNAAPANADWRESFTIDPVLVFRYSAVTWNGHRIHYDAEYARREEGYPGCVMNGALTVHLLVDAALRQAPDAALRGLKVRLVRPLFVGDTLVLAGRKPVAGRLEAWAADAQGALAGTVELELA